jgi:hypothetical protein
MGCVTHKRGHEQRGTSNVRTCPTIRTSMIMEMYTYIRGTQSHWRPIVVRLGLRTGVQRTRSGQRALNSIQLLSYYASCTVHAVTSRNKNYPPLTRSTCCCPTALTFPDNNRVKRTCKLRS